MRKIRSWLAEVMKHIKISIKSFALSVKIICINLLFFLHKKFHDKCTELINYEK